MLISNRHKFIFIHNPKCAGTSIYKTLLPFSNYMCRYSFGQGSMYSQIGYYSRIIFGERKFLSNFRYHITANELKEIIGDEKWNDYLSFAVVRNPYDRLVSNFKYIRTDPAHDDRQMYQKFENFKEFVNELHNIPWKDHQHHYLAENGKITVRKILRFEQIEHDFNKILSELKLPSLKLQKLNASKRQSDFMGYYDNEMIKIVNECFDEDFRIFGYEKVFV